MLRLDLSRDATRGHILELLLAELPDGTVREVLESTKALRESSGHCHNRAEVRELVRAQQLDAKVEADVLAVYEILAQAESRVHGCSVDDTHFHEVGNREAVSNVIAVARAIRELAPERILATSVQVGSGTVVCAHGELDIPAPATRAILDRGIPVCEHTIPGEWCTPTSAAIIAHFVDEFEVV